MRRRTWSFHVVVLQRTAKKCTKIQNARAETLFCSLNLLFCAALVAVAVVVCQNSLLHQVHSFWLRNILFFDLLLEVAHLTLDVD